MDLYATVNKPKMKVREQEEIELLPKDAEFNKLNELYDECINYLKYENIEITEKEDNQIIEITNENQNSENPSEKLNMKEKIIENRNLRTKSQENFKKEDKFIANRGEEINEHHNRKKENQIAEIPNKNHERDSTDVDYESIEEIEEPKMVYAIENEKKLKDSTNSVISEAKSERLRKLSQQLPKIIITQSNSSLNVRRHDDVVIRYDFNVNNEFEHKKGKTVHVPHWEKKSTSNFVNHIKKPLNRSRAGYGDFPKRLVSKRGIENVALISNVPFEKIRMLNDTFHTLINLRWRWIVTGTIVVHFAIWLVFAVFWYITALAHYDFEPDPPKRSCVTGGHDFLTIFLASVEAQTTIGFGDRAIDEECPESIFLFIMQLILGTGLSGVLTCVVYAKLTRPEKLSRDGVGFSKKAVISMRDGRLCLMMRAWDLNYDHIIGSEFSAHFVHTHRTKEGEMIRYYAQTLSLQHRQFLLWPLTLVHVIDHTSPLYKYGPEHISNSNYEITVSLKGASASMGTFTQSQTSYLPKEVVWGHRFPPVVRYDPHKRKYAIQHKKLDLTEPVDTPFCSAEEYEQTPQEHPEPPSTPTSFSEKISSFQVGRSSSFRKKATKG